MNITRRSFLKFASATAIAAASGINKPALAQRGARGDEFALAAQRLDDPLSVLTSEDFKQLIGTEFMVQTEKGAAAAVLSEMTQLSKPVKTARLNARNAARKVPAESFTLSFKVSGGSFSQSTFSVWHPAIGTFDLFLVPHLTDNENLLVAVINRI